MATYIKTLKEDNGDITYPQTKAGAVLLNNGSDLETVLAAKADASTVNQKITVGDVQSTDIVANAVTSAKLADNAITTPKIADGTVTSDKIDWTTLSNSSSYFDIGAIRVAFGSNTQSYTGGISQGSVISFGATFKTAPSVVFQPTGWNGVTQQEANSISTTGFRAILNNTYGSTLNITLKWIAIGLKP